MAAATRGVSDMIREFESGCPGGVAFGMAATSPSMSAVTSADSIQSLPRQGGNGGNNAFTRRQTPAHDFSGGNVSSGDHMSKKECLRQPQTNVTGVGIGSTPLNQLPTDGGKVCSRASSDCSDSLQRGRLSSHRPAVFRNSSRLEMPPSLLSVRTGPSSASLSSSSGSGGFGSGMRPMSSSSTSGQSHMMHSSSSSQLQQRMVQSGSMRKIHEEGLQEAMRDNPARMKRLLSSRLVQQHLSCTLPYRRKLIITARAFVAVFRLIALSKGHSLTRQISLIEDKSRCERANHVNVIVDKRRAALDLLLSAKKAEKEREAAAAASASAAVSSICKEKATQVLNFRQIHFSGRPREARFPSRAVGDGVVNAVAPSERRRAGHGHVRQSSRDAAAKVFSRMS
jgi:hypothetical protein